MQEAAAILTNLVTAFYTLSTHFDFLLPYPKPEGWTPRQSQTPILVWGGSSSVGQYAIQILRYYNYKSVIAVFFEPSPCSSSFSRRNRRAGLQLPFLKSESATGNNRSEQGKSAILPRLHWLRSRFYRTNFATRFSGVQSSRYASCHPPECHGGYTSPVFHGSRKSR